MWPTWLLQAFEFTIPADPCRSLLELWKRILHRGREGGWASASSASSLGNSDADKRSKEGKQARSPRRHVSQGFLKAQMAPGARQVMEMGDVDGCKTTGIDGDCGELGECLPHLMAFKLNQKKKKKHCEDQTKSAGGSRGRRATILRPLEEEDARTRPEARGGPTCEGWAGAGRQEEQAGVFWKMSVFKERVTDSCPKPSKGKKTSRTQALLFPPGWTLPRRQTHTPQVLLGQIDQTNQWLFPVTGGP